MNFLIILFTLFLCSMAEQRPRIIIDHDGGADDAMAIFLALLYEKYFNGPIVQAITTCHGNVNEEQVFLNTQRILDIAGRRDIRIYRGSDKALISDYKSNFFFGYNGLGDNDDPYVSPIKARRSHAAVALYALSATYPKEITLVTLGPLTNVALALQINSDLLQDFQHVAIGAGHLYDEIFRYPEFNTALDVEAYNIVAQYATVDKVTAYPLNTKSGHDTSITREWRENTIGAIKTKIMQAQNSFERLSLNKSESWTLQDLGVISAVLNTSLIIESLYSNAHSVTSCGKYRGKNANLPSSSQSKMIFVTRLDEEKYKQFLLDVFSAELNN